MLSRVVLIHICLATIDRSFILKYSVSSFLSSTAVFSTAFIHIFSNDRMMYKLIHLKFSCLKVCALESFIDELRIFLN